MIRGVVRTGLLLAVILSIAACGGGDSSEASPPAANPPAANPPASNPPASNPPITTPPTPTAAVTFSATSVALTANTSGSGLLDDSIRITVTDRPAAGLWSRVTALSGTGLGVASVTWPAPGDGRLRLETALPRLLGAGIYTTVLKVEICTDSQCASQATGSPMNVTVTYTVTGNALPSTQLFWGKGDFNAPHFTSDTQAPTLKLRISVQDLPLAGIYLFRTAPETGLIKGMVFGPPTFSTPTGTAYGEYTVSLKAPAVLGSGIFTDRVSLRACFDDACAREVPGSRFTLDVRIIVSATEGLEYTRRTFTPPIPARGATNVIWSAARQSLYVVSSEFASNGPLIGLDPLVAQVDPLTGTMGANVTLPGENLLLAAASVDGSYLYVASKNKGFVQRFTLPALTPDLNIPLGSFNANEPYLVTDMATLAGQPQTFVAAVAHNNSHGGTRVYDNAVLRADVVAPAQDFEFWRWLVPGSTADTFISQSYGPSNPKFNNLQVLGVDASGIRVNSSMPMAGDLIAGDRPQRAGNRLFLRDGRILDATTGALLGNLPLPDSTYPSAMLVDESHNRILVWMEVSQHGYLISFDLTTFQTLAYLDIGSSNIRGRMTLWGSDGVALADGTQLIILAGTFFSTYRGSPIF